MVAHARTLLAVSGLTVDFPGVRALDNVDLSVLPGEVLALVGENGAGKSTLLKVLGGVTRPSAGELLIDGVTYAPHRPSAAIAAGIAVIYQEFNLFPDLTVAENIFAGRESYAPATRTIRYPALREGAARLFATLGVNIDPDARVCDLSVSEQQLVEIAKALSLQGRIIVMDEPTAALNKEEVVRLLEVVRRLRLEGRSVIYVTHRLDEVFAVADRATVLRDGRNVGTVSMASTDEIELVRMMVGRNVDAIVRPTTFDASAVVLSLADVSAGRQLRGITLSLVEGEVLGIGGVAGAGQNELTQLIFGALPLRSGSMALGGRPFAPSSPAEALAQGVGFVHEDRKRAGNLPDLSVAQNVSVTVLGRLRRGLVRLLSRSAEIEIYGSYRDRLAIRSSGHGQLISQLSGGNQQKVLLARALAPGGKLLVLNEPTRGVDVGAKAELHALVNELTAGGTAVLMVSSDLPELLAMSDRIIVLSQGEIVGELTGDDRTEENVVACATTSVRIGVA